MSAATKALWAARAGTVLVTVNGFCIGGALANAANSEWRTAAIYGLIGSVVGVASRYAATVEHIALLHDMTDRIDGVIRKVRGQS